MDFDFTTETITPDSTNILTIGGTGGIEAPTGTTAQRPVSPVNGTIRYNSTLSYLEGYSNGSWKDLTSTGTGTVTSVAATAPAAGFTISGSPIITSGTLTFTLSDDLAAVEGLSTTGLATRTASNTWTTRTITGTTNRITLTNGDGVSGNPTVDISSSYVGQATITTLGTVTTGTWNGSTIGTTFGGTGTSTAPTSGQFLYSSGGTNYAPTTLSSVTVTTFSGGSTGLTPASATSGAITLAGTLVLANGGTNASLTATNGGVVYSTASAMAITSAGTSGQFLQSNGAAAPTWVTLSNGGLQLYRENPLSPTTPSATGTNSIAIGTGSAASATNAIAIGQGTSANVNNIQTFANGNFSTAGDAQTIRFTVRNTTTDATTTVLFIDGSSQRMVLPNNSMWCGKIRLSARRTDATGGSAAFSFDVGISRDGTAASTTLQGSARTIISRTSGSLTANVVADTTNGALELNVSGLAGQTFRWVATVELTQVTN